MKRFLPLLIIFSLGIMTSCEKKYEVKTQREIASVYDNGQEKLVLIYVLKNGDKILKKRELFFETGELNVVQEVRMDGLLLVEHGARTEFYKSGIPSVVGYFTDGRKDGTFNYYKKDGFLEKTKEYKNDIQIK